MGYNVESDTKQDGYLFSMIWILFFVAGLLVLSLTQLVDLRHTNQIEGKATKILLGILFGIMSFIAIMFWCVLVRSEEKPCCLNIQHSNGNRSVSIHHGVIFFIMFIFLVAIWIIDLWKIVAHATCEDEKDLSAIFYSLMMIVYATVTFSFCFNFHEFNIPNKKRYRIFVLSNMVSLALWIGLEAYFFEADELLGHYEGDEVDCIESGHMTTVRPTDKVCSCEETSAAFHYLHKAMPFLYPVQIEFCLFCEEYLLKLLFNMGYALLY